MYLQARNNSWIVFPKPKQQTNIRLFCFPYAGGGASAFRPWQEHLPNNIELAIIQLPGREARFSEPLLSDIQVVITTLVKSITPYLVKPFIFFGHSLGAKLAYGLAQQLQKKELRTPEHLIVSADNAPFVPSSNPLHGLDDEVFIKRLSEYNGLPDHCLENHELMSLLLPRLRADIALSETVLPNGTQPLDCPITAIGGLSDPHITMNDLSVWQVNTQKEFVCKMFPGDHFFIDTERKKILALISQIVKPIAD